MRKKFVQIATILLAAVLLTSSLVYASPEDGEEDILRVGIYYGSSAMAGANLANAVGAGFQFGYYDDGNSFTPLAEYTGDSTISIVKAANVSYGTKNEYTSYYDSVDGGGVTVGCWHLQLFDSYSDYYTAQMMAEQYSDGFVAYIDGTYYVRVGNYTDESTAYMAQTAFEMPSEVVSASRYGINVIFTGTSNILFQYDDLGEGTGLGVEPIPSTYDEKCVTYFYKGYTWYGGFRYERINGGNLTIVNIVSMEDYISCVISNEMSDSWPLEALKAQAVAARSYAVTHFGRHSQYHFDICNSTDCQAYYGTNETGANTAQAAEETRGEYAWYDGEVAMTVYHSSDGGATENCENVWVEAIPYLRGVIDPHEELVADEISRYSWTKSMTGAQLQEMLIEEGFQCGEIVDIHVSKSTDTGNVYSVTFTDEYGTSWTVSKDSIRSVLNVSSLRFTITGGGEGFALTNDDSVRNLSGVWVLDGNGNMVQLDDDGVYAITGSGVESVEPPDNSNDAFVFSGTGRGHNLGMSQWGAYSMATQGYSYRDILEFYYTGIEIY